MDPTIEKISDLSGTDVEPDQEANDLLRNGILVETSKGLVCMSLNDALSSNLNLSVDDLRNVAAQLIIQQNVVCSKDRTVPNAMGRICDSDGGFSSECSDSTYTTSGSNTVYPSFTKFSNLPNEVQLTGITRPIDKSSEESDSTKSSIINDGCVLPHQVPVKKKGRGGWPKGRKRKPELLNLPPKAPATSYNLYLNEQRGFFKDSKLPFYEITKIIGNRWSSLTLEQKKPYLEKAEEDKKRYRDELKQYRQSGAYRSYLNKKRKKRLQNNVLSESDMDATDDFDEEDNEELYCRTCDQWFHNMHNKREHLQAKKHLTSLAGDIHRELSDIESSTTVQTEYSTVSTSLDESSMDGSSFKSKTIQETENTSCTLYEAMCNLEKLVQKREYEVSALQNRQQEAIDQQRALCQQLLQLNERYSKLKKDLSRLKEKEKEIEISVFHLWQVPSWFVITDPAASDPVADLLEGAS
ncbi:uncharacterized protein LOC115884448 isoform X2 [Sitophilus oryzae]|uniref:Uncharacterized protein LOC115884448 isoform X2 n=1 Tax=Sitophilus oryzae TaxID=7048 RepID=A0A6J2Y5H6_SITOR|nr:uncharacterized protein LOC115884448 isoform X2 [Sitophilus oryzae]